MIAPPFYALVLASVLFAVGLVGVLIRRNLLFVVIAIEVMLNAAGLLFIAGGANAGSPDGQTMFLFIIAIAATEAAIGLALIVRVHRMHQSVDGDLVREEEEA